MTSMKAMRCSESSISTKMVTWGVMWKVRATIALPLNRYSFVQYMVIVEIISCFSVGGYCKSQASCGIVK